MIKVYGKPSCMQCQYTEQWLQEHNILYEKLDVTSQPTALERVKELGFQSLPVVEANGQEAWSGFRPERLEGLASGS